MRALEPLSREAVVQTGNAVESYLGWYGNEVGTAVHTIAGINGRIDTLHNANNIPTKFRWVGKYLGHIRNAADHGVDANVGKQWEFRDETGREYVQVALGWIKGTWMHLRSADAIL